MNQLAPSPPTQLESLEQCDLCGGRSFTRRRVFPEYELFTGETFTLVQCDACALQFVNPRPTREEIGKYYPTDYRAYRAIPPVLRGWQKRVGAPEAKPPGIFTRLWLHLMQAIAWYVVPPWRGGGAILDVGCGSGKFLDVTKLLGWRTAGVDPSDAATDRARAKGHDVVTGPAEELHHPAGSFDVVYLWHVLEHTHSPMKTLENCHRSLKAGGRFYLCIPNWRSFHRVLFGKYWWSTDAPRHLFQFEEKTIRAYLEKVGFTDVRVTTRTGASSWLRGVRHTINGWFGTRWRDDPAWALGLCEVPVAISSMFRFFGVGSELRVTCRKA